MIDAVADDCSNSVAGSKNDDLNWDMTVFKSNTDFNRTLSIYMREHSHLFFTP